MSSGTDPEIAVTSPAAPPAVVLVHGLWMTGWDMWLLGRRLRRCGFRVYSFSYSTVRRGLAYNAAQLARFLERIPESTVHLVGHSLGGLVIRRLFLDSPEQRPGRVVTLGTPHKTSRAARRLHTTSIGRWMLGHSRHPLTEELPAWNGGRDFASIAGDLPIGAGRLLRCLPSPHDGTVAVDETLLPGASHQVLHATHMGMLVSRSVARSVCSFLRTGRFDEAAEATEKAS